MNLDNFLSTLPREVRESPAIQGLAQLIQNLQEQLTKAEAKIDLLEKELARYRKTPKKPKFRPNSMEPRDRGKGSGNNGNSPTMASSKLIEKEISEIAIKVPNPPLESRFKGYQTFTIQEIGLIAKEITYKLEVWQSPTGEVFRAKLPAELQGQHFGTQLKALATNLYSHGMTQPALHEFFQGIGIEISSGQISNILLEEADAYSKVSEEILTAGLVEAPYTRVDDTGEKHQYQSVYCTHIGGEYFAYYKTTSSKSRENFLTILLQGKEGYHINEAMIWHLFQSGVEDDVLNLFEAHKGKTYRSVRGITRLLNSLGLTGKKLRKQCIEGGLVGFISGTILKPGQVLLSDRAGQFALFDHAGCWVHMERPLRKIVCTSAQVELELKQVREVIWTLYRALKEAALTQTNRETVNKQYTALTSMKTLSAEINAVIANFATYRDEMLKALDHPGLPLHNNDSERDIRAVAKRRNLSGSTKSNEGRKFRDGLLTLKQTCFRLGYNFWEYLQRWFRGDPPNLANLIKERYRTASA